jgi:hypothetical protein
MNTEVKTVRHAPFTGQRPAPTAQPRRAWGKLVLWIFLAVLAVAAVAAIVAHQVLFAALKRSEPYRLGLQQAQQDTNLIAELGAPIEDVTWFPLGQNFKTENGADAMHVDFRVAGPKTHATIQLDAEIKGGKWILKKLVGTPDGGRPIVLDRGEASGEEEAPVFNPGGAAVKSPPPPAKTEVAPQIDLPEIPGM